jgi:hypothetical protein
MRDKELTDTRLDRALDRAIAAENRAFLADPAAIADAQAEGDLYRRRLEGDLDAQPIAPPASPEPRPRHGQPE